MWSACGFPVSILNAPSILTSFWNTVSTLTLSVVLFKLIKLPATNVGSPHVNTSAYWFIEPVPLTNDISIDALPDNISVSNLKANAVFNPTVFNSKLLLKLECLFITTCALSSMALYSASVDL